MDSENTNETPKPSKCGYITILGKPNAGKSTLLNSIVGDKIVGVSRKPQTTRQKLLGICVRENCQYLFLDTPGLHSKSQSALNSYMNKEAWSGVEGCNGVLYLIDGLKGITEEDETYLKDLSKSKKFRIFIVISKMDRIKKIHYKEIESKIKKIIKELIPTEDQQTLYPDILQVSAKNKDSIDSILTLLSEFLPEGPFLYDSEIITDKPEKYIISEIIREKLFRQIGEEIPYKTTVIVEKITFKNKKVFIDAVIIAGQKGHKSIIIGHRGQKIKEIGQESRTQLEKYFDKKVMLTLLVQIDENWFENPQSILEYETFYL